ncbi:hypothetical protein [Streptomyces sp. NPDC000618]|uniref:hypothetical protein n=1 Tax=Streptomyces sp. NPDC000618 TaxID=3154265 RepID=UPI003331BA66
MTNTLPSKKPGSGFAGRPAGSRSAELPQQREAALIKLVEDTSVTAPEPLPADHRLRHLSAARLSPHIAWRSRDNDSAFVDDFAAIWQALQRTGSDVPGVVPPSLATHARAAVRGTSTTGES